MNGTYHRQTTRRRRSRGAALAATGLAATVVLAGPAAASQPDSHEPPAVHSPQSLIDKTCEGDMSLVGSGIGELPWPQWRDHRVRYSIDARTAETGNPTLCTGTAPFVEVQQGGYAVHLAGPGSRSADQVLLADRRSS